MIKSNQLNQQGVICILFCISEKKEKIREVSQAFMSINNYGKGILEKFFHVSKYSIRVLFSALSNIGD